MDAAAAGTMADGRQRVIIEAVTPEVDGGRFPVKRVIGEPVRVAATIFTDGHDRVAAVLKHRGAGSSEWTEVRLESLGEGTDRWGAEFEVRQLGVHVYTLEAWVDPFATWRGELEKKFQAGQDISVELAVGSLLIEAAGRRADSGDAKELVSTAQSLLVNSALPLSAKVAIATSPRLAELMWRHAERRFVTVYPRELRVIVDRVLARFGAWYELFPRSTSPEPGRHGTFMDLEARLPAIAEMGFDVVYLPPIHPIGSKFRKGRNGTLEGGADDPGSPWAIGSPEGGHKAVHPRLGTLEDFRHLVAAARGRKLEIALDIAFQCSPDHPYVAAHPEWFRARPDGTIQYAENPPKKYQDIYPFHFECEDWRGLWTELKSIFEFWIEQGVTVFRVDNPHTKSFAFWEWCLGELKQAHPELIFLAEAFTRRTVMYYLAKIGFTQSYNYFPWRNTKPELTEYLTEVASGPLCEYFWPNLWTNTPDILTQYLQYGGRPAFVIRLVLAATLGASYGVYGPSFELGLHEAREAGSEEYLDSEKYEIKHWDLEAGSAVARLIARVNRARRENPALQGQGSLRFHQTDNEQLLAYSKRGADGGNLVLVVVNLDPRHTQRGWIDLPLGDWGIAPRDTFQANELLTGEHFLWSGPRSYVELNPRRVPAHIFQVRRFVRTEQDFDYFM